jgi:hypothetical protein
MFVANIFKSLLRLTAVLGLTLLALPTASAWSIFGQPQNKQECMLQNLKGVSNETVAQMIVLACEKLFPSKNNRAECVQRELTPWEVQQLQWTTAEITQLSSGPYFSAKFYNGAGGATIAAVTINIYVKPAEPPDRDKKIFTFEELNQMDFAPQYYEMQLDGPVAPKEIGKVTKSILKTPPKDWAWEVTSVKACQ